MPATTSRYTTPYAQPRGPTVGEIAEPLVKMPERTNQALCTALTSLIDR
jgi:hypothetical protein